MNIDTIDWNALRSTISKNSNYIDKKKVALNNVSDFFLETDGASSIIEIVGKGVSNNPYAVRKRLLTYYKLLQSMKYKNDEVREVYKKIYFVLKDDFKCFCDFIQEDIRELDVCYSSGAYKATLILAGSILEAFLLDWLSEIDGKNYFVMPYKIRKYNNDGTFKWVTHEELKVYINQMEKIGLANWEQLRNKAHFIRKKRNLVHAKICLERKKEVNKDISNQVITYLKEIVESRLEKRRKELDM